MKGENEFFLILIGINIGITIGWFSCKKFKGNLENLMKWLNGKEEEVTRRQNKEKEVEAKDVIGVPV